jgi:hypothetical protein
MRTPKKFTAEAFAKFYPQYLDMLGGATMALNSIHGGHSKTSVIVRKANAAHRALMALNEELLSAYKVRFVEPEEAAPAPVEQKEPEFDGANA